MSDWISVEDRVPEDDGDVLVTDGCDCSVAFFRDVWTPMSAGETVEGYDHFNKDITVTHWMPLPEPPKTNV